MNDRRSPLTIECCHTLKVRYGETDQMGVVYHANYPVWFHEARDVLFSEIGVDLVRAERDGYRFPLIELHCRYLYPARYGDEIDIHVRWLPELVARMRFQFEARNRRTARLLSVGTSVSVVTDRQGRLMLRLPEAVATCLQQAAEKATLHSSGCKQ